MAEKINLASFDIDVDQLVKATQDVKQRIDEIKKEQQELQKAGKGSSEAFINNAASLKSLNKEYGAQIKVLSDVSAATGKTIPLQQQLDSVMNREVKTISDLRKQNSDLLKTRNNVNLTTEEGQKQLALINAQMDKNNKTIKENVSEQEQQRLSVGGYTEAIQKAFQGSGLFGGALNDVKGVLASITPILGSLRSEITAATGQIASAAAGTETMSTAQKAAAVSSNVLTGALKILKVALISTGIGAIVVALGSLVAMFRASEEGQNRWNKILLVSSAIIGNFMDLLADLGEAIFNAITKPREAWQSFVDALERGYQFVKGQVVDRFIASWNILFGAFEAGVLKMRIAWNNFTGDSDEANALQAELDQVNEKVLESARVINEKNQEVIKLYNDAKEAVTGFIDEQRREAAAAADVADMRARADIIERELLVERSKRESEIADLRLKSRQEEEFSASQRAKFLKEAQVIEDALLEREVEYLTLRRDAQVLENSFARSNKENLDAQAQAEADLNNVTTTRLNSQRQVQRELNRLNRQAAAEANKMTNEAIKRQKAELDLFIAEQGIRARTLEQELELERQVSEKRKAIFQAELDAKKISQEKYQAEILKLNQDLLKRQAELSVDNARRELDALAERVEQELQAGTFLTDARLESLEEQQEQLAEAQAQHEELRFEQGLINEQEYQDALKQIAIDKENSLAELRKERQEAQKEERALQMDLEIEALEEQNASIFEIENLQIEQQRERDLEAAREKYRGTAMLAQAELLVNSQADQAKAKLAAELAQYEMGLNVQLLDGLAKTLGEETALGKAAAVARTLITTREAALNAYNSLVGIPVVGPALAVGAAAAASAFGAGQIANIAGVDVGFGKANLEGLSIATGSAQGLAELPQLNMEPGFAAGGKVNRGIPIRRSNGDNVIITAKKGEAILNENQQAFLGRDLLGLAGVPGFATGGVVASPASTTTVQNIITNQINAQLSEAIGDAVQAGAEAGTFTGSRDGIVDLSNERNIALEANF